jgi:hypothetical protein
MSISTLSAFYFGHTITVANASLDFDEGGPELQANLNPGDYTLEEFLGEVKRAMDAVGALTYSVSIDRTTRIITIASTSNFRLRVASGTRFGTTAYTLMGFTGADRSGAATYNGNAGSGSEYLPQHKLWDYVSDDDLVEKTDAVVNTSASGKVQVVLFGTTMFIEFKMGFATNKIISPCQPEIETRTDGVAKLRAFMSYTITKAKFEFMPDRTNRNAFKKVLLERTDESRDGTAFRLSERKYAPGYYDAGKLILRIVE